MVNFLANNLLNHFVQNSVPFSRETIQALVQTNKLPKKLFLSQLNESFVQKVS